MDRSSALSLSLAALLALATLTQAKVDVSVFYESHCPDSQRFILYELYPSWPKIQKYVDLNFIPFGKAKSTRNGFECQHGPRECRSNMFMSCALTFLKPGTDQLSFVNCFMANPDDYTTCVDRAGLSHGQIQKCSNSDLGRDLQLSAERETKFRIPHLSFVPTVVFNKVFHDEDLRDIQSHRFLDALCRYQPEICRKS